MPFLELFDETLDINSTESYDLSLQVCNNYLSFSILDNLRNKYVMLRSYEPEEGVSFDAGKLGEIISMDDFLMRRFRRTSIITPSPGSTLVPSPLYDESRKEDYFHFNHPDSSNEIILANELKEPDSFLIFAIPRDLHDLLGHLYPGTAPLHHLKPLFGYFSLNRRMTGQNTVNVHLERGFMTIFVYDNISLRFCNTFDYQAGSDIRYYLLYVFKLLGLKPEENLVFSGRIGKNDEMVHFLSDYLMNIKYAQPSGNFTLSYIFNETEIHKYLTLFIAAGCE